MRKVWIYQRPGRPGYWVGWYENGKRKAKRLPNKALAEHFQHIKYTQMNQDVFVGQVRIGWDDLIEMYKSHKKAKGLKPSGLYQAIHTLELFADRIRKVASTEFTAPLVEQFIKIRLGEVDRITVAKDIRYLKAFVTWASDQNFMKPFKIARIKTPPKPVVLVPDKVIKKMLTFLKDKEPTYHIRMFLALCTGLRREDIGSLQISDINLKKRYVSTSSQKTEKLMPRRPIPRKMIPELRRYIKSLPKDQTALFADTYRRKKWLKLLAEAKVPHFTFQQMRKTFASTLTHQGGSKAAVQKLTEHTDERVLDEGYLNVDPILEQTVNLLPIDKWSKP